jgi:hypothetical protein
VGTRGEPHKPTGPRAAPNHEGRVPATCATPGAPCAACRCIGIISLRDPQRHREARVQLLFLDGMHKPRQPNWDRSATTQPRPHRPNFQVQHLLCPTCGPTLTEVLASWSAWEVWRERNPDNNGPNGCLILPLATTDQAETETGTTSKTPTTAETKETTTTKAAEQGTTTHTSVAAPPAALSASSTQSAALDPSIPPPLSPSPPPPPTSTQSPTHHHHMQTMQHPPTGWQ